MTQKKSRQQLSLAMVLTPAKAKCEQPPRYKVYLLNDDYTPMGFVVKVLEEFFYMNHDTATAVMLQVHERGRGICGVYSRDIAETKVAQVNDYARAHEHPLLCCMEEEQKSPI